MNPILFAPLGDVFVRSEQRRALQLFGEWNAARKQQGDDRVAEVFDRDDDPRFILGALERKVAAHKGGDPLNLIVQVDASSARAVLGFLQTVINRYQGQIANVFLRVLGSFAKSGFERALPVKTEKLKKMLISNTEVSLSQDGGGRFLEQLDPENKLGITIHQKVQSKEAGAEALLCYLDQVLTILS